MPATASAPVSAILIVTLQFAPEHALLKTATSVDPGTSLVDQISGSFHKPLPVVPTQVNGVTSSSLMVSVCSSVVPMVAPPPVGVCSSKMTVSFGSGSKSSSIAT